MRERLKEPSAVCRKGQSREWRCAVRGEGMQGEKHSEKSFAEGLGVCAECVHWERIGEYCRRRGHISVCGRGAVEAFLS